MRSGVKLSEIVDGTSKTYLFMECANWAPRGWVDPETGLLHLDWAATDPAYYTDTQRGSRTFVRTDLELGRFDCVPELGHAPTG